MSRYPTHQSWCRVSHDGPCLRSDAALPSAAPLDLDALERLAAEVQKAKSILRGDSISFADAALTTHAIHALRNACSPDVILALVAAARRGVEDREDAERYRFLRPHLEVDGEVNDADYATRRYTWVQLKDEQVAVPDAWAGYENADAAIDAARAALPTEDADR